MALTSGFYNSEGHDRIYDAVQFGSIFDGVIKDGVFEHYGKAFMVREIIPGEQNIAGSTGFIVAIQPGRAWFNHTWSYNDADELFELPAPELALDRIDAIVLRIDHLARENTFAYITGTPGDSPAKPAITRKGPDIFDYPIAYIRRKADSHGIEGQYIENAVGTAACPFSTGLIEGITTDDLVRQWQSEWKTWSEGKRVQFQTWFSNLQLVLDEDVASHLQHEIDQLEDRMTVDNTKIYMDYHDGRYGINTDPQRGADTFVPFRRPATGTYRYPNNSIGALYDMGEDHTIRYVDATAVYNKGVADALGGPNAKIKYTYHHHTITGSNIHANDSDSDAPGQYADNYQLRESTGAGCFTVLKTGTYTTQGGHEFEATNWRGNDPYMQCKYCGAGGYSWDRNDNNYPFNGSACPGHVVYHSYQYYGCGCGLKDTQRIKAEIDFVGDNSAVASNS